MDAETPRGFLQRAQAARPFERPDKHYRSAYLKNLVAQIPALEHILADAGSGDYAVELLSRLRSRLPREFSGYLDTDAVAIGEVHDALPGAWCTLFPDERFAIVFNSGLRDFTYRVIRAFSTRFVAGRDCEEQVSFEETCRIIGDIFLWFVETGRAYGPSYPISHGQFYIANRLTFEVNAFFLAHELGHGAYHVERFRGLLSSKLAGDEELMADEFALRVLLARSAAVEDAPPLELSYSAAELALLIWQGLEVFGVTFESSHPRAAARLDSLRSQVAAHYPNARERKQVVQLGEMTRLVFDRVLDEIGHGNYEAFLDRSAEQLVLELDQLLDECTGGQVPNYMTFYSKASELFERGISLKIAERMASVAGDFFSRMQHNQPESEMTDRNAWVAFQKFKLFVGFVTNLPEPLQRVFQRSLGMNDQ